MSIKYINCYGTSFTQGGGFEYWKNGGINIAYKGLNPMVDKTHLEFSWPGQLQRYLGNDYKVTNYGKCGFGNERIYRMTHEIINNPNFNPKEHIFLFEFSDVGRKEVYHADLDKYLICNYSYDSKDGERIEANIPDKVGKFHQLSLAYDYWFETKETESIINKDIDIFREYFKRTISLQSTISDVSKNIEMFLSYLEFNNVQYIIVQEPFTHTIWNFEKHFQHRCLNKGIIDICHEGDMTIDNECNPKKSTDGSQGEWEYFGIDDKHGGYYWAIYAAHLIFKQINKRYFKSKLISHWEGLTKKEIKDKIALNFKTYEESKIVKKEEERSDDFYKRKRLF